MNNKYMHNPLEGNKPELVIDLEKSVGVPVSIIIIHKDRPEYLNILLQSIVVCSQNSSYEIIVVDNGSARETQDFLTDIQKEVKVIRNLKNQYWSAAANHGTRAADPRSKYFIFLHSDVVILNPSWIDLLISVAESNNSGMVGIETASYVVGNQKVDFISEWCMLISRDAFEKIGPWPEILPLVGNSFIMTVKAQIEKIKPQVMKNIIAHHYKIFGVNSNEYEEITEKATAMIPKIYQQVQATEL
jgi:glycosyltransferase involved in cell wall biosynthesis